MIKVLTPGFYTSIQDLGRNDYTEYGVPLSGVMDIYSAKMANALVGNSEEAAVLELTMNGPKLEFRSKQLIAITGANLRPKLNNTPVLLNMAIIVNDGDILSFGRLEYGFRSYLAISGGFLAEKVFGSRSMFSKITAKSRIESNDILKVEESSQHEISNYASIKINKMHFNNKVIEVYAGPEFDQLAQYQKEQLLDTKFTISKDHSRMAYQLSEGIQNNLEPIITSSVLPGTVQLTPSGSLIILMRDCQTTGGYPRVLQLSELAINRLGQKYTGHCLQFSLIDYV